MSIQDISSADLQGVLAETKTDSLQYEATDCQVSNTASVQYEFLSAGNAALIPERAS